MKSELRDPGLTTDLLIDVLCDRFEEAWLSKSNPCLEDFLGEVDEPTRSRLLQQLLRIELEYRARKGLNPVVEDYAKRFPQHRPFVEEVILSLDSRADKAVGVDRSTVAQSSDTRPEVLHDREGQTRLAGRGLYQVLRQHAQGGLGTVSVARDQQLHREVALKEIQPRFRGDAESQARFVNEAEITGRLEHPGIVPVYALDQDQEGMPFYVMRFVRGQTLRDAIESLHPVRSSDGNQPMPSRAELRKLLRRFLDVCNTVAYAHSRGIIHRDLKPQNILLGPHGETLVVDWGLAKVVDRHDQPNSNRLESSEASVRPSSPVQTQVGRIAGTPGYMAPEQVEGAEHLTIACDIFGLGATLYCLLTGRSPRGRSNSRKPGDPEDCMDFKTPRQIVPRLPRSLAAICQQAMHVEPTRRYRSATALAEDLDAWLEDEPVSSYSERPLERFSRWTRKNRSWVRVAAAALAIVAVVATIAALTVDRARRREVTALERATDNLQTSLEAIDKMLTNVGNEKLAGIPQLSPVRQALLDDALSLLESIHAQQPQDPGVRHRLARVQMRVGRLAIWRDAHQRAHDVLNQAREMSQRLREEFPGHHPYTIDLMEIHFTQAKVHEAKSEWGLAESFERQGLELFDQLPARVQQEPQHLFLKAQSVGDLAYALCSQSKMDEAEAKFRESRSLFETLEDRVDQRQHLNEFARMLVNHGSLLVRMGNTSQAEAAFSQSLSYCRKLVSQEQVYPDERQLFSQVCGHLAQLLLSQQGSSEAAEMSRRALEEINQLAKEYPTTPLYQLELGLAYGNTAYYMAQLDPNATEMGQREQLQQDQAEITRLYEQAIDILTALAVDQPSVPRYLESLANTHNNMGIFYSNLGDWDKASEGYRGVIRAHRVIIDQFGESPDRQSALGAALNNLALSIGGTGDLNEARDHFLNAIEFQEKALQANPDEPSYRTFLRNHLGGLSTAYALLGFSDDAIETGEAGLRVARELYDEFGDVGSYRGFLNSHCLNLARVLQDTDRNDVDFLDNLARARDLTWESIERSPHWHFYKIKLAEIECQLGNLQQAEEALKRPTDLTIDHADRAFELLVKALLSLKQGHQEEARKAFEEANKIDELPAPSYITARYYRYRLERLRSEVAKLIDDLEK